MYSRERIIRRVTYLTQMLEQAIKDSRSQFRKIIINNRGNLTEQAYTILSIMRTMDGLSVDDLETLDWLEQHAEKQCVGSEPAIGYKLTQKALDFAQERGRLC